MRKTSLFRKVAKSFAGRLVCRLMGEEKGAVMLEYILVTLLVAATAVCAVAMYGTSISDMFVLLSDVSCNNISKGTGETASGFDKSLQDYRQTTRQTAIQAVATHVNTAINDANPAGQTQITGE